MKRGVLLAAILLILAQGTIISEVIAGTPHTAYGKIFNSNGTVPAKSDITFVSYITTRPGETQTQSSPNSSYSDGYWNVAVGDFPTAWTAGDVLRTEVTNKVNGETGAVEVVMTNAGSDQADDLHLGPVPVELSAFTVFSQNGGVVLKWSTETETNNYGFEIQRKQETDNFKKIGFLAGHGTTTSLHHYSYKDADLSAGTYYYRLKQVDHDGSFEFSEIKSVVLTSGIDYMLAQNYPNPFNSETTIHYQINQTADDQVKVALLIYNSLGEVVRELVNEQQSPGKYSAVWDGRDNNGNLVSSGLYISRLISRDHISSLKMVYMK